MEVLPTAPHSVAILLATASTSGMVPTMYGANNYETRAPTSFSKTHILCSSGPPLPLRLHDLRGGRPSNLILAATISDYAYFSNV